MGEGIHCSVFAKLFTKTLGIKQKNAVALGFVASLYGKEFCVINPDNICKRILENGEWWWVIINNVYFGPYQGH